MNSLITDNIDSTNELLKLISGKWRLLILWHLSKRHYWFNELKRALATITPSTLSKQLAQLEEDNQITKHEHKGLVPWTEYSLSRLGKSLVPLFKAIDRWAENVTE